ncbi:uncharacterized protein LOC120170085 [Hibiscus syriacus]|uniref:uncharacterized protein LOC120170085 n=1 Tax=Hibiscus syriacus TaxID=106335 RepID=UPI001921A0F4|nr:uncharacterized protein LOC120170085 [Hibiscus syriacus]
MDTFCLPNLEKIGLESCSDLKSFCMGSITLQCPSLKMIEVDDCPKMYAMACTREICVYLSSQAYMIHAISTVAAEEVIFTDEATAEEEITEAYWFTKLEVLELIRLPKLATFFHGENSETDSPTIFNQKVVFPNLIDLTIQGIGKCRKIWHDKPTMNSFKELTFLWVKDCERLSNILPFRMVKRLEKLETLAIDECKSVEEIIGPDDDHLRNSNESHAVTSAQSVELKSITMFVFPNIRELYLRVLPKLKGFYSKVHTTELPSLKILEVSDCSKVENLAREYINFGETQGESQPLISVQKLLFWVTEVTVHKTN